MKVRMVRHWCKWIVNTKITGFIPLRRIHWKLNVKNFSTKKEYTYFSLPEEGANAPLRFSPRTDRRTCTNRPRETLLFWKLSNGKRRSLRRRQRSFWQGSGGKPRRRAHSRQAPCAVVGYWKSSRHAAPLRNNSHSDKSEYDPVTSGQSCCMIRFVFSKNDPKCCSSRATANRAPLECVTFKTNCY